MPFVYLLVRRQGTVALGLWMALWYLLLPGATLSHMTIGVCDHHVVEMLISVLCVFLLHRLVVRERERPLDWWRPAWGAALPLAILQFTWLGGPLFLPIFGLAGLGQVAADVLSGAGALPMVRAGARYWIAFFLLTASAGGLVPELLLNPDLWKVTLVGTAGVLIALPMAGWLFTTSRLRLGQRARLALAVGSLALALTLLYAASQSFRDFFSIGLGHKSTLVAENQPVTARFYFLLTGLAGILGLFAPIAGIVFGAWRRPAWWIAVLPSLFFVALWYRTYDYVYQGALHAILLTGYFFGAAPAIDVGGGARCRWWSGSRGLACCTLVVFLCCWPAGWTVPLWMPRSWYEDNAELPGAGWIEAMRWLRTVSPPLPTPMEHPVPGDLPRGRVGVLTDWSAGQFVNVLAGRPATSSRYPDGEGIAPFLLQSEDAVRAANLRGSTVAAAVRYVALDPNTIGDYFGAHIATVGLKQADYYGRGTFVDARGHTMSVPTLGPAYDAAFATRLLLQDGDGFSHFRLVFESREQSFLRLTFDASGNHLLARATAMRTEALRAEAARVMQVGLWKENGADAYLGHLLAAVKIFEQVEGAKVEGRAPAGAAVTFDLPLRLRTSGRSWHYRQTARADSEGRWKMIVPYATEPVVGTDLEPAAEATIVLGDGLSAPTPGAPDRRVKISESAVQNGEIVTLGGVLGR